MRLRTFSLFAAGLAATVTVGVHTLTSHAQVGAGAGSVLPNTCSPTAPVDGGQVCATDARAGITPDMVANAQAFAACLGTQGVIPPVVVHDVYSITFTYAPGVVPSDTALTYCHANAVRVPSLTSVPDYCKVVNCGIVPPPPQAAVHTPSPAASRANSSVASATTSRVSRPSVAASERCS